MQPQVIFAISVLLGLVAWGMIGARHSLPRVLYSVGELYRVDERDVRRALNGQRLQPLEM